MNIDNKILTKRDRNVAYKRLLGSFIKHNKIPKTQVKLFHALSSFYAISTTELKNKTGSKSIRSLVRDTNSRLRHLKFKHLLQIRSMYKEERRKGYYRLDLKLTTSKEA